MYIYILVFWQLHEVVVSDGRLASTSWTYKQQRLVVGDIGIQEELLSDSVHSGNYQIIHLQLSEYTHILIESFHMEIICIEE